MAKKKELVDLFNLAKQTVDGDISHYLFTITGDYGAGKSSFANELFNRVGNAVIFGFEDRFKGINGARPILIRSWKELLDYKKMLRKGIRENNGENPFPFNTIIIDPMGKAAEMCEKYVCEENEWDSLGDAGFGKGYNEFFKEFSTMLDDLTTMGFTIQKVAHNRLDTITPQGAAEGYQVYVPDVPKKLKYIAQGEPDFVFYLDVVRNVDEETRTNKPVRRLYLQNYADFELKSTLKGLPDYIEFETVEEGVDMFIEAFNKAVAVTRGEDWKEEEPKKRTEPAESAKPDPVEETEKFEDDTSVDVDMDALREQAVDVRTNLLEELEREEVIEILKQYLGTPKINEVQEPDKLIAFIKDYEAA